MDLDKIIKGHSLKMSKDEIHKGVLQTGDIINIDGKFYILESE